MDALTLKRRLFDIFGGFGDKRIKDLNKGDYFICDGRGATDLDARGQLFSWFCTIGLRVVSGEVVHVEIGPAMPTSPTIKKWWGENTVEGKYSQRIIRINKGDEHRLGELADLIEAIIKKRYDTPAYKYVCPRTASSLRLTQKFLSEAWSS